MQYSPRKPPTNELCAIGLNKQCIIVDIVRSIRNPHHNTMEQDELPYKWFWTMTTAVSMMGNHGWMSNGEAFQVQQFWGIQLDDGAIRTLWCYMKELTMFAFTYVAKKYFDKYASHVWCEWHVHNPSAALVALVREIFWTDELFMRRYRVGRYA